MGIKDLNVPSFFRVDRGENAALCKFESAADSRAEDAKRAKLLRTAAATFPEDVKAMDVEDLASMLEHNACTYSEGQAAPTLASSMFMRELRIKVSGAIWRLVESVGAKNVRAFAIVPRHWQFTAAELKGDGFPDVDPLELIKDLRADLYAKGARKASGWIIAFLHGEHDPIAGVFRLHVHGLAYGEMEKVLDRLRKLPNYRTQKCLEDGSPSPIVRSVWITRQELTNLPSPITYLLQSFWPSKPILFSDGKRIRRRDKMRMKEPQHSQVLLWMDHWQLKDLTLLVGLRATSEGLKTKAVS